jgi:hypothetical protein
MTWELIVGAVLLLLALLATLGCVFVATRNIRTSGWSWIAQTDGIQTFAALVGVLLAAGLAFFGNARSNDLEQMFSSSLRDFRAVELEYTGWTATLRDSDSRDFVVELLGAKRPTTHEPKCFELTIRPLYRDVTSNTVDDPLASDGAVVRVTCDAVPLSHRSDRESLITVSGVNDRLGRLYDGRPQIIKIRSPAKYQIQSVYVQLAYWHSRGGSRFALETMVPYSAGTSATRAYRLRDVGTED